MTAVLLQADDLSYRYDDGTVALRGLSLGVARGEKVGLIGPNGSGKSTLLLCLAGLLKGRGVIRLDGTELSGRRWAEIRGRVGLVFQSPDDQLFMPTLADDLAFGPINLGLPADKVREHVRESASALRLTELLDRPPHHLSMGQKRIAAIATVLAMRPAVLLMDEPSSNLDARSRRRLIEVLQGLETTLLVASHDLVLVERVCTRVLVIDDGRIAVEGQANLVLHDAATIERYGLSA
ncbi:MAG TPA: ABC transporter ATP-binding protein [Phycisphaerae bacterium]|nr:ABC transporter ATP-binding protein [Phycisphaerae bacterium]